MKRENLVLSNETTIDEVTPWKIWKPDLSSVGPQSVPCDKGLTLDTLALQIFYGGNSTFINSRGKGKLFLEIV